MNNFLSLIHPIIPGKGIGPVKLGMPVTDILPAIKKLPYQDTKVAAYYPGLFEYQYKESLSLYIYILTGKLVRIDMYNNYEGTYTDTIGINSTVRELRTIHHDIAFDESYLLIGEKSELIMQIDYDDDIRDIDSVLDNKITRITLELMGWAV
jgi:hypothetical protein